MITLDDRLMALRGLAAEFATAIRPFGLELDGDPSAIHRRLDVPLVLKLGALQVPPAYQTEPLVVGRYRFHLMTTLERVVFMMEAARGDLGFLLAAPGAPMAGAAVAMLGDERQQEWFFSRVVSEPTWAFFALSEPRGGSDASGMRTRLTRDPDTDAFRLDGTKRYIGNGMRAQVGVAFAKRGRGGPLSATAVLVDAGDPGFSAVPVPTLGLRGAQLSELTFDSVPIAPERVLGSHLSATRGGLWGWLRTFNLLRPVVAAMGVGVAQAAHDYVGEHRPGLPAPLRDGLERLRLEIQSVRRLTLRAAAEADLDPSKGELSSAAKVRAATLAEEATRYAARCFGTGGLLDHPYLEKLLRDARGIEFMEGAGAIQRMSVFSAVPRP
ncbi:acyl-CoA dehydrogenase family protein [Streptomyces sp. NPDC020096]